MATAADGDGDGDGDGHSNSAKTNRTRSCGSCKVSRAAHGWAATWPAAIGGHGIGGAEKELNEGLGLRGDSEPVTVPLAMFVPIDAQDELDGHRAEGEEYHRADAVTDLSAVEVPVTPGRFLSRVFPRSLARYLGVTFESVPVGHRVHTTFVSGATADTVARDAEKDAEAASLNAITMNGNRLSARYLFEIEDVGRIPQLEARLRSDLSMAMSTQQDAAVFNGDAGLKSPTGLKGLAAAQTIELSGRLQCRRPLPRYMQSS